MARLTNFAENKLNDHIYGKATWAAPTNVHMALFTSDPGETGSLAGEVTGTNYARKALSALMGVSASGLTNNSSDIVFNTASAVWGTITHVGVMPSSAGSEMMVYAPLETPIYIDTGDTFRINANNMTSLAD